MHPTDPAVVAVVPARAGSRGIADKNLRRVGGVPLVARAVQSARRAALIDHVVVSTDGAAIADAAVRAGAEIVQRPVELADDLSTSESALLHTLDELAERGIRPEVVVFIQATSPFISPDDLDASITRVLAGESDVVFAAVESHAFLWRLGADGAEAVNHDASVRPRRQDREPQYLETGAFYAMRAEGFRRSGFRFFGRVGIHLTDMSHAIEIDTPEQLELADALAATRSEHAAASSTSTIAAAGTVAAGATSLLSALSTTAKALT